MSSRLNLKMGPIEVEYEGSEIFIKTELLGFVEAILRLYQTMELPEESKDKSVKTNKNVQAEQNPANNQLKLRVSLIDDINAYLNYDVRRLLLAGYADWQINDVLAAKYTLEALLEMEPDSD